MGVWTPSHHGSYSPLVSGRGVSKTFPGKGLSTSLECKGRWKYHIIPQENHFGNRGRRDSSEGGEKNGSPRPLASEQKEWHLFTAFLTPEMRDWGFLGGMCASPKFLKHNHRASTVLPSLSISNPNEVSEDFLVPSQRPMTTVMSHAGH